MTPEGYAAIIAECDHERHGGAGYTLDFLMDCGRTLAGCRVFKAIGGFRDDRAAGGLLPGSVVPVRTEEGEPARLFIDLSHVSAITVNW